MSRHILIVDDQPELAGMMADLLVDAGYDTRTADVNDADDVLTIPVGLGVGYRLDRLIADLRGTYRPAFDENLVLEQGSTKDHRDMDAWQVTLHAGFEF